MKSKNKLVPRLLGITKESVMRVEEKTKDVVQEWPLTTVKRWAASPKSFTLVLAQHTFFQTCIDFQMAQIAQVHLLCSICMYVNVCICITLRPIYRISGSIRRATTQFRHRGEQISQLYTGYIDIIILKKASINSLIIVFPSWNIQHFVVSCAFLNEILLHCECFSYYMLTVFSNRMHNVTRLNLMWKFV